jgi:hypothetical protein
MAKVCLENSYGTDFPISTFHGPDDSLFIEQLQKYNPDKALTGYGFGFKD